MDAPPLDALSTRRRALGLLGGAGVAAVLAACGSDADSGASTSSSSAADRTSTSTSGSGSASPTSVATSGSAECVATPEETAGPFPADGSNGPNVLDDAATVRSDIRSDQDGSDTQEGVPMTLRMRVLDSADGCAPLAGAAVYVWHCNKEGEYSQYDSPMLGGDFTEVSWLRGVQVTDDDGRAEFSTILPGRYQGRAFHIHFEVYESDSFERKLLTSQLAADDAEVAQLYSDAGYENALSNDTSNARDNVFSDGVETQTLTFEGDVASGLIASRDVTV